MLYEVTGDITFRVNIKVQAMNADEAETIATDMFNEMSDSDFSTKLKDVTLFPSDAVYDSKDVKIL